MTWPWGAGGGPGWAGGGGGLWGVGVGGGRRRWGTAAPLRLKGLASYPKTADRVAGPGPTWPAPAGQRVLAGLDQRPPSRRPPFLASDANRVTCATVHRNEGQSGGQACQLSADQSTSGPAGERGTAGRR